jgi:hypothetical protein
MDFSANDITQLTNLLNPESDSPPEGVFSTESFLSPGTLGTQNKKKSKAEPNHKVKATINRASPKPKFESKGRPEPEHKVWCIYPLILF